MMYPAKYRIIRTSKPDVYAVQILLGTRHMGFFWWAKEEEDWYTLRKDGRIFNGTYEEALTFQEEHARTTVKHATWSALPRVVKVIDNSALKV